MKISTISQHVRRTGRIGIGSLALAAVAAALLFVNDTAAAGNGSARGNEDKFVAGESTVVSGGTVSTWARVNGKGKVIWVGMTMPVEMIQNQPPSGSGPAGAVAVLNFPAVVQDTTYFNHVEIHSQRHGHVTPPQYVQPNRYGAPHFDIHFYSIPVEEVWTIPGRTPPLPPVAPELLPAGWAQPGGSLAQMGRHAQLHSEFTATDPWLGTMVAGFLPDASYMHFIEPMITREFLLRRQNFTLPVPMPETLGRATRYPTELVVHWDKDANAYHFIFKGFEEKE